MSVPKVTYGDYEAIRGEADERAVKACLPYAEGVVRELCYPNEPETEDEAEAWKRAVCAAVAADMARGCDHGMMSPDGFTLGSFSVSGASGGTSGTDSTTMLARALARRELLGTNLLYQGVGAFR